MHRPILVLFLPLMFQPAMASDFSGPHVDLHLGFFDGKDKGAQYSAAGVADGWGREHKFSSSELGIGAGYNWVKNDIVYGLEASISAKNSDTKLLQDSQNGVPVPGNPIESRVDNTASIVAKIGKIYNQKTMIYLLGGVASAEIYRSFNTSLKTTDWNTGWTAGAGIEHQFTSDYTVKAQFRHANYGEDKISTSSISWNDHQIQEYSEQIITFSIGKYF